MDLTFVQTSNMFGRDGAWETEFSVDQEFNLHLERESSGKIIMMQKTAGTFFDIVKDFDMKSGDVVYDYDSASFLGTKTIKIVSESAIRFASLTTSGEVTEIKSQSKEIEVTSNGTTEVTPDAGFAYLNSVKVKTNVAQSGEGGGSASSVEYLDLTGLATLQSSYLATSSQELHLKMTMQGQEIATVGPAAQLVSQCSSASKVYAKIDFDAPVIMVQGTMRQDLKVRDYILSKVSESELASIPRITKEEFYTL